MSDYELNQPDESEDDYALDKGNLDEREEAKEEDLQREQEGQGSGGGEGEREQALTGE
jgi:hypothetical protein